MLPRLIPIPISTTTDLTALRRPLAATPASRSADWSRQVLEHRLQIISDTFERQGGLWSDREVERRLRAHVDQPISILAHWIVGRRLVTFLCQQQRWVPAFQFDAGNMSLRRDPQQVLSELADVFDDFDVADWFASPNLLLQGAAPVDRIGDHPCCVLAAARLDRFVANGC